MGKRGNKEGSIYRRESDGKWCATITLGRNTYGKFIRKTFYGKTRSDVAEKLHEAKEQTRLGVDLNAGNITVEEWLQRYFEVYKATVVRPVTYEGYLVTAKNYIYPYIGKLKVKSLRPDIIQEWLNNLSTTPQKHNPNAVLSARTINFSRTLLKAALEQACRDGIIIRNPVSSSKAASKDRRKWQALTREEQQRLIKHLSESTCYYANMFLLALYTGLRPSEITALKWSCIDLDERTFHVKESAQISYGKVYISPTKTSSGERAFPMTEEIYSLFIKQKAICEKIVNPNNLVFPSKAGTYIDNKNILRTLKEEFKKAGVNYTSMRGLRHTFGTRAAEAGINPAITQQLMGHSSSQITLDYYTEAQTEAKLNALSLINIP
jgi:integrase